MDDDKYAPAAAAEAPALSSASAQVINLMEPQAEAESFMDVGNALAEGFGGQPDQGPPSRPPAPSSSVAVMRVDILAGRIMYSQSR